MNKYNYNNEVLSMINSIEKEDIVIVKNKNAFRVTEVIRKEGKVVSIDINGDHFKLRELKQSLFALYKPYKKDSSKENEMYFFGDLNFTKEELE